MIPALGSTPHSKPSLPAIPAAASTNAPLEFLPLVKLNAGGLARIAYL